MQEKVQMEKTKRKRMLTLRSKAKRIKKKSFERTIPSNTKRMKVKRQNNTEGKLNNRGRRIAARTEVKIAGTG